ncbi:MAG: AMP-binding protein [Deltaproteobacteria bacterium]|jgi:acetyl-CoA synthetase|nr:AMP-binding protein [Deltaproteobacteria bacterium]MBW2532359.1 AMP-binding protein [Deltaproteobacteria bacterium]
MATLATDPQRSLWRGMVARVRADRHLPFEEQWRLFSALAAERPAQLGPMPAWWPDHDGAAASNVGRLMAEVGAESYRDLHRWSVDHRDEFWNRMIHRLGIAFAIPPQRILDAAAGPENPRWLPGARLNIVDSCFAATACTIAVAVGREGSDEVDTITYGELESLVNRVANGLAARGFGPGTGIALYMPMNLECVAAYLGAVRAGCFVVSIADSFAPHEVRRRLEIAGARAVVTVDAFERAGKRIPLYDKVKQAGGPTTVAIPSGTPPDLRAGDLLWSDLLGSDRPFSSVETEPTEVTNVLFSSGTTGDPKAIPWDHLTPIKAAADGHLHQNIGPGSVVAWPTNIGWMMGPWLIYASLINRACMALYEGVPSGPDFTRFVARAGVGMLGVVPSLVAAWRASGACEDVDWSRIEVFSSTGEPSNAPDYLWLMSRAGYRAPVVEYCGGTEIGGGYITGTVVQPASPATFSTPALGLDMVILDERGRPVAEGENGEVYLAPPSIGLSQRLLNRDHHEVYYEGCPRGPEGLLLRRHGDQMERLAGGFFRAHGRADDTMNLGGVKVSSVELEAVLGHHPAVAECAAVAVQPAGGGADRLVVFAVLREPHDPADLEAELGRLIAAELNPLFKIHDVVVTESLPRTASNKLMRRTLRAGYMGKNR